MNILKITITQSSVSFQKFNDGLPCSNHGNGVVLFEEYDNVQDAVNSVSNFLDSKNIEFEPIEVDSNNRVFDCIGDYTVQIN